MISIPIEYTDFNGVQRTEVHHFNLTETELMKMELLTEGGLTAKYQKLVDSEDVAALVDVFENLVLRSYGVKDPDGKRFIKSEELSLEFSQTNAYNELFLRLLTDPDEMAKFIKGVIPDNLNKKISAAPNAILPA